MKIRNAERPRGVFPRHSPVPPGRKSLALFFIASIVLAGCAAPGVPVARKAQVPSAVTDLAADQVGGNVIVTFTLPKDTATGRPLKKTPAVEIYRAFVPASTAPGAAPVSEPQRAPALFLTVPPDLVESHTQAGRFLWADPVTPDDFTQHAAGGLEYMVRTRESSKKASADSNFVDVPVYPAPVAITDLTAELAKSGVELKWSPPQKTITGSLADVARYDVYRAEVPPEPHPLPQAGNAAGTPPAAGVQPALTQIGTSDSTTYLDPQVKRGKTYAYAVRGVMQYPEKTLESDSSNTAIITFQDIFPPAAPQGLIVVLVPAQGKTAAYLDLSWDISPETDLAGYNVYRSEQDGVQGTRLNSELLLTPAFRDMNAVPGRRYFYTVTAVDRSGNESPASASASGGVPTEGQPAQ